MKYFAVVNFVCLPYEEYIDKNDWYDYFRNIKQEGRVLYGWRILYGSCKGEMDRAEELLIEAKDLLEKSSYKSANNRAFYAIE